MDLPIIPPPVPVPTRALVKEFYKSKVILVIAYIQIAGYFFFALRELFDDGFFDGGIFDVMGYFFGLKILFLVPALVIIFAKNQSAYKIARIFLIVECVLFAVPLLLLFIFLSNF